MMKIIGLTGGIGSGKSTVSQLLIELGAVVIDTDKVGHGAFQPGSPAWQQVVSAFGKQVVAPGGEIDRKKLGEIVFGNSQARLKLEQIMHPAIFEIVCSQIAEYRRQGVSTVVLEVPLLVETGWTSFVDEVWVTTAPKSTILKRLEERSGMTADESRARIRSQLSSEERLQHADVVIDTDCTLNELKARISQLWQ